MTAAVRQRQAELGALTEGERFALSQAVRSRVHDLRFVAEGGGEFAGLAREHVDALLSVSARLGLGVG